MASISELLHQIEWGVMQNVLLGPRRSALQQSIKNLRDEIGAAMRREYERGNSDARASTGSVAAQCSGGVGGEVPAAGGRVSKRADKSS